MLILFSNLFKEHSPTILKDDMKHRVSCKKYLSSSWFNMFMQIINLCAVVKGKKRKNDASKVCQI